MNDLTSDQIARAVHLIRISKEPYPKAAKMLSREWKRTVGPRDLAVIVHRALGTEHKLISERKRQERRTRPKPTSGKRMDRRVFHAVPDEPSPPPPPAREDVITYRGISLPRPRCLETTDVR